MRVHWYTASPHLALFCSILFHVNNDGGGGRATQWEWIRGHECAFLMLALSLLEEQGKEDNGDCRSLCKDELSELRWRAHKYGCWAKLEVMQVDCYFAGTWTYCCCLCCSSLAAVPLPPPFSLHSGFEGVCSCGGDGTPAHISWWGCCLRVDGREKESLAHNLPPNLSGGAVYALFSPLSSCLSLWGEQR